MLYNNMEKGEGAIAMDVEHFSKLGTEHLQQGQMQKAMEAFTNAYKSAQALGNHGYMQRACAFNLGALLISMSRFNDGLHYLNLAKPDEGCRDGRSNGDLYFNCGLAYEGLKNIPESRRHFEKALEEYCSEHSNVKMEADTTRRLGQLCVTSCMFSEAEAWMKKLIQAYESLGDKESRFQAEAERANLLLKMGRVEEAEEIADDCLKSAKSLMSPNTGNVFNELGLVYTQMTKYEKALDSSQCALSILKSSDPDGRLIAVLYQNMGALYNYMGRFHEAVEYHKMAIEKHAELRNRKSQGHCFINLGYAHSQLKELDKAGESFLHAAQAAKDCGDKKSEWQSFEALGSVAYSLGDLPRAKEYYKQSLSTVGQSPEVADKDVQDRILGKLTHVIQVHAHKSMPKHGTIPLKTLTVEKLVNQTASKPLESELVTEKPADTIESKDQRVIAIKRGSVIKHLKVRRSGTLRQFKKFALGLDVTRPNTAELKALPNSDDISILSAETINKQDVEEKDGTGSDDSETEDSDTQAQKPAKIQDGIEADDDSEESGDDFRKVQAEMKRVASLDDIGRPGTSGFVSKTVSADVHAKRQDTESDSEDEDSSDEDSNDDSEDDEEKGRDGFNHQKNSGAPPVPSLSPPVTKDQIGIRTYEKPIQGEPLYETIDHHAKAGGATQELTAGSSGARTASGIFSGTVYETIRSQSRLGQRTDGSGNEADRLEPVGHRMSGDTGTAIKEENEEDEEDSLQEMSRAQRDVLMFSEFKKDAASKDKSKEPASADEKDGDQKNSKHCIVM